MIIYKMNVMNELKNKGYSPSVIKEKKIFGEKVASRLRKQEPVSFETLDKLCVLLDCNIGDIIAHVSNDKE